MLSRRVITKPHILANHMLCTELNDAREHYEMLKLAGLDDLVATLPSIPVEYRVEISERRLIDERDRFKIWAGALEALQLQDRPDSSRLKEFPTLEMYISKLLRRLAEILSDCKDAPILVDLSQVLISLLGLDIIAGVRPPLEFNADSCLSEQSDHSTESEPDDQIPKSELEQHNFSITSILSDLFKNASKIRRDLPISHNPVLYNESVQVDDYVGESDLVSYVRQDREYAMILLLHCARMS